MGSSFIFTLMPIKFSSCKSWQVFIFTRKVKVLLVLPVLAWGLRLGAIEVWTGGANPLVPAEFCPLGLWRGATVVLSTVVTGVDLRNTQC